MIDHSGARVLVRRIMQIKLTVVGPNTYRRADAGPIGVMKDRGLMARMLSDVGACADLFFAIVITPCQ